MCGTRAGLAPVPWKKQDPWGLPCLLPSGVTGTKHLAEMEDFTDDCEGH